MISLPFSDTISLKKYVSGIDVTFTTENIKDSLLIAALDIRELISEAMYDDIIANNKVPSTNEDVKIKYTELVERLRFALVPLALYDHFIWLQLRVSSNSITTVKSDRETTAFKYQTDEARESLLNRYALFVKELIDYLEAENDIFEEWKNCNQRTEQKALLITSYRDFDKSFNTEGNAAFFIRSRSIQQDAFDEIDQHIRIKPLLEAEEPNKPLIRQLKKALAYLTISRALYDWDNVLLPSPIRRLVTSETSQSPKATSDIVKQGLSAKYRNVAMAILSAIDTKNAADKASTDFPNEPISVKSTAVNPRDKFYLMS